MRRVVVPILLGLIGAGIVHIAILFLIPVLTERDSWARLAEKADLFETVMTSSESGATPLLRAADPEFEAIACRIDITDAYTHVRADGILPYWSASVYDRAGRNIYSLNDRTAAQSLDLVVATPAQMLELRKALPSAFDNSVFVETESRQGIVVIRAFAPDESWRGVARAFLDDAVCEPA